MPNKIQFNQKLNFVLRRLIHFRPHGIRRRSSFESYIRHLSLITRAGLTSSAILPLLVLAVLFPICHSRAEAVSSAESETTLTIATTSTSATLDLLVTSASGTFSSSTTPISFTVATNNFTGYTLSLAAQSGTSLTSTSTDGADAEAESAFATIASPIAASTFQDSASTTLNGHWGFLPSKYYDTATGTTISNPDTYLPSPTTTAATILDKTSATNSTANPYTIGVGARADYSQPAGTYSGRYTLSAVGNYPKYTIVSYADDSADSTTSGIPATQTAELGVDESITLDAATPTRANHIFMGWCSVATSDEVCSGTVYQPGDPYAIDQATSAAITLHAMWFQKIIMQDFTCSSVSKGDTVTLYDLRDDNSYTVSRLADGNCWMLDNLRITHTAGQSDGVILAENSNFSTDSSVTLILDSWINTYGTAYAHVASTSDNGFTDISKVGTWDGDITTDLVGVYYNSYAASAGSITGTDDFHETVTEDICPANWHLPIGGPSGQYTKLYDAYNNDYETFGSAFRALSLGRIYNGVNTQNGADGYWKTGNSRYVLELWVDHAFRPYSGDSSGGLVAGNAIRCVQEPTPVLYMQDVTTDDLDTMIPTTGQTATLQDRRTGKDYDVVNFGAGYWMTTNLEVPAHYNLRPGDSNVTESFKMPANDGDTYVYDTCMPHMIIQYGNYYYNWPAATARNSTKSATDSGCSYDGGLTVGDICPAGWRIPTAEELTQWTTQIATYGRLETGGAVDGTGGQYNASNPTSSHFWTATRVTDWYASRLGYWYSSEPTAGVANGFYKSAGLGVRCVSSHKTLFSLTTLQEMTPEIVANTTTPLATASENDTNGSHAGDNAYIPTKSLYDRREHTTSSNSYSVAKLADGNIWMLDNLRLGGDAAITLTSSTTNLPAGSSFTLPASSTTGFANDTTAPYTSYTQPAINSESSSESVTENGITMRYGVYYNFCAASAGTYCYGYSLVPENTNAEYDVCSSGWHMPSASEYTTLYNTPGYNSYDQFRTVFRVTHSGVYNESIGHNYTNGHTWSSTYYNGNNMYRLFIDANGHGIGPAMRSERYNGNTVRCLAKSS